MLKFTYMRTPLYRYTFRNNRIRQWIEDHCEGPYVLNLFAGKYRLNLQEGWREIRNDLNPEMDADYHQDSLEFVTQWNEGCQGPKFSTVILDPPYSYRKCMTKYQGVVSSAFNQVKNKVVDILEPNGIVITFGYHSNVMGQRRGFEQEHILLMSHGGAIHDTIAVIERRDDGLSRDEIGAFFI
jgi:hypothetical protein